MNNLFQIKKAPELPLEKYPRRHQKGRDYHRNCFPKEEGDAESSDGEQEFKRKLIMSLQKKVENCFDQNRSHKPKEVVDLLQSHIIGLFREELAIRERSPQPILSNHLSPAKTPNADIDDLDGDSSVINIKRHVHFDRQATSAHSGIRVHFPKRFSSMIYHSAKRQTIHKKFPGPRETSLPPAFLGKEEVLKMEEKFRKEKLQKKKSSSAEPRPEVREPIEHLQAYTPEQQQIPGSVQDFLMDSSSKICEYLLDVIKEERLTLVDLHSSEDSTKKRVLSLLLGEKASSCKLIEYLEDVCFSFLQTMILTEADFLQLKDGNGSESSSDEEESKKETMLLAQYQQRILKKIVFNQSQSTFFFHNLDHWISSAEEVQAEEDILYNLRLRRKAEIRKKPEGSPEDSKNKMAWLATYQRKKQREQIKVNIFKKLSNFVMDRFSSFPQQSLGIEDYLNRKAAEHVKEFPNIKEALDNDKEKFEIAILSFKLDEANKMVGRMRAQYLKEIMQMKDQMHFATNVKGYKFINIKFFESASNLNPDVKELLNSKLQEIRQQEEMALAKMDEANAAMNKKIEIYQQLEESAGGNIGIRFNEMSADIIIKKLSLIESNPSVLWDAIEKHYKKGFFYGCIEQEFGITPETHDKLILRVDRKMGDFRTQMNKNLNTLATSFDKEREMLRQELINKDQEIMALKKAHGKELFRTRTILKQQAEHDLTCQLNAAKQIAEEEKKELEDEVAFLKSEVVESSEVRNHFGQLSFFHKLLFIAKTKQLRELLTKKVADSEILAKVNESIELEKKFFRKEMASMKNEGLPELIRLKNQVAYLRKENKEMIQTTNQLDHRHFIESTQKKEREANLSELQHELDNARLELADVKSQLSKEVLKNDALQERHRHITLYNETLEAQQRQLKMKVERLNQVAAYFNQKTEVVNNSIQHMNQKCQETLKQQKDAIFEKLRQSLARTMRTKGCQTLKYQGVNNILKMKKVVPGYEDSDADNKKEPMFAKGTQTYKIMEDGQAQTDPVSFATPMSQKKRKISISVTSSNSSEIKLINKKSSPSPERLLKSKTYSGEKRRRRKKKKDASTGVIVKRRLAEDSSEDSPKDSVFYHVKDYLDESRSLGRTDKIVSIGVDKPMITEKNESEILDPIPDQTFAVDINQRPKPLVQSKESASKTSLVGFINKEYNLHESLKILGKHKASKSRSKGLYRRSSDIIQPFTEKRNPFNGGYFSLKNLEQVLNRNLPQIKVDRNTQTQGEQGGLNHLLTQHSDQDLSQWLESEIQKDFKLPAHKQSLIQSESAQMKPLLQKKKKYRNHQFNSDIMQYMEKEKYDALTSQLHFDSTMTDQRRLNHLSSTIKDPQFIIQEKQPSLNIGVPTLSRIQPSSSTALKSNLGEPEELARLRNQQSSRLKTSQKLSRNSSATNMTGEIVQGKGFSSKYYIDEPNKASISVTNKPPPKTGVQNTDYESSKGGLKYSNYPVTISQNNAEAQPQTVISFQKEDLSEAQVEIRDVEQNTDLIDSLYKSPGYHQGEQQLQTHSIEHNDDLQDIQKQMANYLEMDKPPEPALKPITLVLQADIRKKKKTPQLKAIQPKSHPILTSDPAYMEQILKLQEKSKFKSNQFRAPKVIKPVRTKTAMGQRPKSNVPLLAPSMQLCSKP